MISLLHTATFIILIVPILMAAYLLFLTVSAWLVTAFSKQSDVGQDNTFLFVIPAHNEESLLPVTLKNLFTDIDYDSSKYEVVIIADNCTDSTAAKAREFDATVLERFHDTLKGKGYALEWGLAECWKAGKNPDAVIILDADTIVSANFLKAISANLNKGHRVIQSFYSVLNPAESWSAGLRYAALSVLHFVRPQGRRIYGGSAGLKGNGMVFATEVIKNHQWSASLTEDIEFHMDLLLSGTKVHFAPNAIVWAEMPNSIDDANSQNERWETGRIEMAKKYVPKLIGSALRPGPHSKGNAIAKLDAVMEHIIPPFALFNGLSLALLVVSAVLFFFDGTNSFAIRNLYGALFIIAVQIIYLISGLVLTKAPFAVYKNLLYAPFYVLWKLLLVFRIFTKESDDSWIRTARNEGS